MNGDASLGSGRSRIADQLVWFSEFLPGEVEEPFGGHSRLPATIDVQTDLHELVAEVFEQVAVGRVGFSHGRARHVYGVVGERRVR